MLLRYGEASSSDKIAIEKVACYSQIPRRGGMLCHAGPHGKAPGQVRSRRSEGAMRARDLIRIFT